MTNLIEIDHKKSIRFSYTLETISNVEKFHSDFNAAVGIGAGSIAGGSLAVGSWPLVGALGSASTGAAISGLSGAAATNATLAWFGGGAMAAGGTGVSGGMAMLGGIVAVPLIAIASYSTYKKASEIQDEKVKLDKVIVDQKSRLATLPEVLDMTHEKRTKSRVCAKKPLARYSNCLDVIASYDRCAQRRRHKEQQHDPRLFCCSRFLLHSLVTHTLLPNVLSLRLY